jgi:1-acyl-sn-glycerol-3-phosphate acyltransferase
VTASRIAWGLGRRYMGWPTLAVTRPRAYGRERLPKTGGLVYAVNHMHWLDIPLVGVLSPRNIDFVAKVEAVRVPGIGRFLEWHGTIAVRRGESDRVAVRKMLESARSGRVVGLFVEGTRLKTGRPGTAQPGAAMVAIQAGVPVIPMAIYGTQFWKATRPSPCSIAFGAPLRFDELPKNGRGYKEATIEIERRINVLFDWLAEVHEQGRPKGLVPPL